MCTKKKKKKSLQRQFCISKKEVISPERKTVDNDKGRGRRCRRVCTRPGGQTCPFVKISIFFWVLRVVTFWDERENNPNTSSHFPPARADTQTDEVLVVFCWHVSQSLWNRKQIISKYLREYGTTYMQMIDIFKYNETDTTKWLRCIIQMNYWMSQDALNLNKL